MNTLFFRWQSLASIARYEPEMRRLGVSEVARSPRGFLPAYKRARGDWHNLPVRWRVERHNFIQRHLTQYREHPTYRRWLALMAWAYRPDRKFG
ncbi:MAG: hypothetical protein JRN35_06030 [Nitrososphaerota archaeon]|nr:hypothetical protein [Nitrososphaerota archaeon]